MSLLQSPVSLLWRAAERYPDRVAVQAGLVSISYAGLRKLSQSVAEYLKGRGIAAGDCVALALPNGIAYVGAYYGILAAGGIAVPLNAAAKARELKNWLRHAQVRWVFGRRNDSELTSALAGLDAGIEVILESDESDGSPFEQVPTTVAPDAEPCAAAPGQPASIIFTSGTTGQPKGVVLSHGNLASNSAAIVDYLGLTCDDSIVSVLPFYYSYGNSVLQSHIMVGGRVVIEQNFVYPHLVVESLARERATGFAGVPSTYALLLARVKMEDYDLSSLRYVTQAGGAMSPALTQRLLAALPAAKLFVMYGQTEATARLTWLPPDQLEGKMGSVGIPIPGVELQVRTEAGNVADPGAIGDVWARGPNVMLGYWRDEAATAAVIRDGWLVTGDMGYIDADGFLYLAGRRSDMIKTGAHRVHPGDIEEVIAELSGVEEVAVTGVEDELLGQVIKAFVVLREGAEVGASQIKAHCQQRLAAYKVPRLVDIVASLPKTASGKVKRAELAGSHGHGH